MKAFPVWRRAAHDAIGLFFPKVCRACSRYLPPQQDVLCVGCRLRLPRTGFSQMDDNPVLGRFWGRADVRYATALLYFVQEGRAQRLLHQLKYEGRREIGHYLGRQLGEELSGSPHLPPVDVLVPVPLHPARERARGYNQAAVIAGGIAEALGRPVAERALRRAAATQTQTRKARLARFDNVSEVFAVADPGVLTGRHVLLVDDVVTTGATLEACAHSLLALPGTTVSMAALALAL
jgi:ComF family protein